MDNKLLLSFITYLLLCLLGCKQEELVVPQPYVSDFSKNYANNGKKRHLPLLEDVYTKTTFDSIPFPEITPELIKGLEHQLLLLKLRHKRTRQKVGNLSIQMKQLEEMVAILLKAQFIPPPLLKHYIDIFQIWGKDQRGNIYFTGYFTPVLKVKREPDEVYKYPLYTFPKGWEGTLPTRQEIEEEGVLDDMGLELAYAKDKIEIYFMQVQGSGIVEYPDGTWELFAHNGSNRHSYRSIGKHMIETGLTTADRVSIKSIKKFFERNPHLIDSVLFANPSYIFFKPKNTMPSGAGHVPITAGHTIAVDTRFIPLGSCVLAAVPIIDYRGKFVHHEFRILIAQDIGGAINGAGHVDLYTGIGKIGRQKASALHHFGRLWILLPPKPVRKELANKDLHNKK